jgi:hypothetical protein
MPSVGAQLRDSEFRCKPARHHLSANVERGREEIVILGNAITADVKSKVRVLSGTARKQRGSCEVWFPISFDMACE